MTNYTTTELTIQNIKYIKENEKYIEIGIKRYNSRFDISIKNINNILGCNILSTNIDELDKIISKLDSVDYIDVTEKISILVEDVSAIISEENDPITTRLNKYSEEER